MERLWEKLIECYNENPALVKSIVFIFELSALLSKKRKATISVMKLLKTTNYKNKSERIETMKRKSPFKRCNYMISLELVELI